MRKLITAACVAVFWLSLLGLAAELENPTLWGEIAYRGALLAALGISAGVLGKTHPEWGDEEV